MLNKLKKLILADFKNIFLYYRRFIPVIILLLVIFVLPVFFPVYSHSSYLKTGVQPYKYSTLISISLVSLIPMLFGLAYGNTLLHKERLLNQHLRKHQEET
jgi:hypothetical protein